MLLRVTFTYSIDRQGQDELNRITTEIRNLVENIRINAPQRERLEFHISFRPEADDATGPRDTCTARGIYLRPEVR